MKSFFLLIPITMCLLQGLAAQNYHAVQGSSYAGSLGVANNPASIINTPFPWDVTLFGTQIKSSTNALTVHKYSLLSNPANSEYQFDKGNYSRYANINFNTNLLNARIALNRLKAVAFGINLRGYAQLKTSDYNFIDTLKGVNNFFRINETNSVMEGDFKTSSWIEIFATYSQTIWDTETDRLNGGFTIKASRGISGAFAQLQNVTVEKTVTGSTPVFALKTGNAKYGYSSNYDTWKNDKTQGQNIRDFITHSEGGASIDIGFEYITKPQAVTTFNDDDNYYDYEWKIGIALLDLGINQYKYGAQGKTVSSPKANITDALIESKFDSIRNIRNFNDSMASIASTGALAGKFTVLNPARLVINADRYLYDDFYVNGEVSLNLSSLAGKKRMYVTELNFITLTPRWETKRWGAYLPMQYTTDGRFWIGGAFKAGPLLLGFHNWANIFAKNKIQNGGGYLALVLRSPRTTKAKTDRRLNCPRQ